MREVRPEEYDAAVKESPKCCPLALIGDLRSGQQLLDNASLDTSHVLSQSALSGIAGFVQAELAARERQLCTLRRDNSNWRPKAPVSTWAVQRPLAYRTCSFAFRQESPVIDFLSYNQLAQVHTDRAAEATPRPSWHGAKFARFIAPARALNGHQIQSDELVFVVWDDLVAMLTGTPQAAAAAVTRALRAAGVRTVAVECGLRRVQGGGHRPRLPARAACRRPPPPRRRAAPHPGDAEPPGPRRRRHGRRREPRRRALCPVAVHAG